LVTPTIYFVNNECKYVLGEFRGGEKVFMEDVERKYKINFSPCLFF